MAFDHIDKIENRDKYLTELKKELAQLKEGALGEFQFFDGITIGGTEQCVLLVGNFKDTLAKDLKAKAKARATGTCFREGNLVKMTPNSGKLVETKVKNVFKETKNYGVHVVEANLNQVSPSPVGTPNDMPTEEDQVRSRVNALMSTFDEVKGAIGDDNRKTLRVQIGNIETALEKKEFDKVRELATGFEKAMTNFAKQVDPGHGQEDPQAKANALQRWKDTTGRFDKVKGRLTDEERKAVREKWGVAEEKLKASDWTGTIKALEEVDRAVIDLVKAALKESQDQTVKHQDTIDKNLSPAAQLLVNKLTQQGTQLEQLRLVMLNEMKQVETIRQELRDEQAKPVPDGIRLNDIKQRLEAKKLTLDAARKGLDNQRKDMAKTEEDLKAQNLLNNEDAVQRLQRAKQASAALEDVLQSIPFDQASQALEATVKKMAEATEWRDERFQTEGGGVGTPHATSRHGAQTGLEAQARRAASGVTPDQPDNKGGTAQTVNWNEVEFTYTEVDGKREISDRTVVAQNLINRSLNTANVGRDSSMWATPVLEKEAFDLAMSHAAKLKKFKQFKSPTNNNWRDFLGCSFVVNKTPGWGYSVKRDTANMTITPAAADQVLQKFEKGEISLDQLFKDLGTTLYKVDGGAKMVPYAVVVMRRANNTADWSLHTQYPDVNKTAVKWEPAQGWNQATVDLRETVGGPVSNLPTNALP